MEKSIFQESTTWDLFSYNSKKKKQKMLSFKNGHLGYVHDNHQEITLTYQLMKLELYSATRKSSKSWLLSLFEPFSSCPYAFSDLPEQLLWSFWLRRTLSQQKAFSTGSGVETAKRNVRHCRHISRLTAPICCDAVKSSRTGRCSKNSTAATKRTWRQV